MLRNWLLRRVKVVAPSGGTNRREQEGIPVSCSGKSKVLCSFLQSNAALKKMFARLKLNCFFFNLCKAFRMR